MTNSITIDERDREEKREYTQNGNTLYLHENKYDSNSNILKEIISKQN